MKSKAKIEFIGWRYYLIVTAITFAVMALLLRLFDLTIWNQFFLLQQGNERVLREVSAPAFRGMITDRNGFPLAISTRVYSIWANPKEFLMYSKAFNALSKALAMPPETLKSMLAKKKNREFIYLKRGIAPPIAKRVMALRLPGIYFQKEFKRFYPEGETTAHVIGFTNIDDQGQEGIELAFNDWLRGHPGKKWVIKDRLGRIIADVQTIRAQKPGNDLTLSIDKRLQYLAYRELSQGVLQNQASSGSVVILEATTGEILAIVNYPAFNPNQRVTRFNDHLRNRAVTDMFEPGSTLKAFSVAAALADHTITPDTIIDTSPGWLRIDKNMVRDPINYHKLTIPKILQKSSNVGITKIVLDLPPYQLVDMLRQLGFGEITGIGFPGEQAGLLNRNSTWDAFVRATLAFGYGISTTTLQLANAYGVLANQGNKIPVTLLHGQPRSVGKPILTPEVAQAVLQLLESVIQSGTGEKGRVPGYRVAGKTGTSWTIGKKGYEKHNYTATFVGIAPLSHPQIVVAVVVQNPKGKNYQGGLVAGPIFEKIMEGTLRLLNIPPDAEV